MGPAAHGTARTVSHCRHQSAGRNRHELRRTVTTTLALAQPPVRMHRLDKLPRHRTGPDRQRLAGDRRRRPKWWNHHRHRRLCLRRRRRRPPAPPTGRRPARGPRPRRISHRWPVARLPPRIHRQPPPRQSLRTTTARSPHHGRAPPRHPHPRWKKIIAVRPVRLMDDPVPPPPRQPARPRPLHPTA